MSWFLRTRSPRRGKAHLRRRVVCLVLFLVMGQSLSSCADRSNANKSSGPSVTRSTESVQGGVVQFLTWTVPREEPLALVEGRLERRGDGCTVLQLADATQAPVLVWPDTFALDSEQRLQVLTPGGQRIQRGESVVLGGGYFDYEGPCSDGSTGAFFVVAVENPSSP